MEIQEKKRNEAMCENLADGKISVKKEDSKIKIKKLIS